MNAEIISVGTELLLGEILNSDVKFLSKELSSLGINVYYQTVVGDNAQRLSQIAKQALSRSDIVIFSGGLGPTQDDITKETVCSLLGKELVLHSESLEKMKKYLEKRGIEMPECNIKQAMLPPDSIVLENTCGTAPGCIIESEKCIAILLPGPPHELKEMYLKSVRPYLLKKSGSLFYSENLKIYGIGESKVSQICGELIERSSDPTVAPYAETPGVRLRLTAKCKNEDEGKRIILPVKEKIKTLLGEYIYSETGETLPEAVVHMLIANGLSISSAESCTGGMFAKLITDIPGSSAVLSESYVTYANEAKEKLLGVSHETLKKYGAVSEETAYEMANGLYRVSGSDFCCVFTGIAGPGGGSAEKPVGLVYTAVSAFGEISVYRLDLSGTREQIRYAACLAVFDKVRRMINAKNKGKNI